MPNSNAVNVFLSFDFGMKSIGVAVGQSLTYSATPLNSLSATDGIPSWQAIEQLIQTWEADAMVVGLPLNTNGNYQAITYAAKKFANRLHHYFKKPVFLTDERLTTVEAKRKLGNFSNQLDSYAAKLILETWLREHREYSENEQKNQKDASPPS